MFRFGGRGLFSSLEGRPRHLMIHILRMEYSYLVSLQYFVDSDSLIVNLLAPDGENAVPLMILVAEC